jgi:pSer/pThr/pTyr-binding forkhead associated (FHA) protein
MQHTPTKTTARLVLNGGMTIPLPERASLVLGRATADDPSVEVDLTPYGARHSGVSRRHARLHRTAEGFAIEDLGSHNETCLNAERLAPGQLYPLAPGDHLILGAWRCTFQAESG